MRHLFVFLTLCLAPVMTSAQCVQPCETPPSPTVVDITVCDEDINCGEDLYLCLPPPDELNNPVAIGLFRSTPSLDRDTCNDSPSLCDDEMMSWWISCDPGVEVVGAGWDAFAFFTAAGCYFYGAEVKMFMEDEGIWAKDLPGGVEAEDSVKHPADGLPARVYVTQVDIDTDSNYDGVMDARDEAGETTSPGRIVVVNDDDDNGNSVADSLESGPVSNENDLVEVKLFAGPSCVPGGPNGCHVILRAASGGANIKVWTSANKGTEISLPNTWQVTAVPATVWVEGVALTNPDPNTNTSAATLELVFVKPDSAELCGDTVLFTIAQMAAAGNARLKEVSYIGAGHTDAYSDWGVVYSAPHWADNSNPLDGDAFDAGDVRTATSYARATTLTMTVTIRLQNQGDLPASVLLEGRSPNGFTTYQLLATTGGDPLSRAATPVLAYPDLPNQVDCFLPLIIHWYVDAGGWKYVGTSATTCT